jgi:hypothetical protein
MGFGLVNLGFQESLFSGTNADFGQDSHPCLLQLLGPREEQLLRLFNVFERLFIVRIEKRGVHANLTKQRTVCRFATHIKREGETNHEKKLLLWCWITTNYGRRITR